MQRRAAIPVSLVWLLTVLSMWALTTAALAVLISAGADPPAIAGLVGQSALSAALACVVIGGPATAVALRVRRRHGPALSALAGIAVAALVLVFLGSYMAASGAALRDTWNSVAPVFVVTVAQLAAAFALRGHRPTAPAGPAAESAAADAESGAADPEPAAADSAEPRD